MIRLDRRQIGGLLVIVTALLTSFVTAAEPAKLDSLGSIERLDERLDALIPRSAVIEKLAEGFNWSEGPVWDRKTKELYFSDVPENVVFAWNEKQGVRQFLKPSGYTGTTPRGGEPGSNGLLLEPGTGKLVLCQHGDRRIARMADEGKFDTLAGNYDGKRFNSPNDGAYKSNGDLYFTDPPYGLLKLNDDPTKEIPFNGVYRVSPDKTVTLLTQEMTFPNGIAFSHDEKYLYVAQSDPKAAIWRKFPVKPDGTLGASELFFDSTDRVGKFKGLPDGMKVDVAGNVFATGPGGVLVFAPDGQHLGTILTGEATGNCCFGDDGSTLYIMADMYLCRVKTTTKGSGF